MDFHDRIARPLDPRQALARGGAQSDAVAKIFPIHPSHPERNCWGCDRYCAAHAMICGNGTERTQHPSELFGDDWDRFGLDPVSAPVPPPQPPGKAD